MIEITDKNIDAALARIAAFVAMGDRHVGYDADSDLWYLGGGYWRAKAVREEEHNPESRLKGIVLINPDRKWEEARMVEKAASICLLGRYEGPEVILKE